MSEAAFAKAFAFLKQWEGGDSLPRPGDPNPTRAGLTEATDDRLEREWGVNPETVFERDPKEIERAYRILWLESGAAWLPEAGAVAYFDSVVNLGQGQAVKLLQRALGVTADGALGPDTLAAMKAVADGRELAVRLTGLRIRFYKDLVVKRPEKARWMTGWTNRVSALQKAVGL